MAIKITARRFFMAHYLKVSERGVVFMESAGIGAARKFSFGEIEYILMSANNVLSFQVKDRVYSIPVDPTKPKHKQAIDMMVASVRRFAAGFPVPPPRPPGSSRPPPPLAQTTEK